MTRGDERDIESEPEVEGEIGIIERRRRILECFSDMMSQSLDSMKTYFNNLEEFRSISQADQETLFNAAILESLILKVI
jgi:hypothetical protein